MGRRCQSGPGLARVPRVAVIATEELTKRYGSRVTALDRPHRRRRRPASPGWSGANGAGKSTLIKILLGLLPATSGSAARARPRRRRPTVREIRELVGYMPEHDCLPPDVTATELVVHLARMSGLPTHRGARAGRRHAAPRRALRGALPADRRLLHRHEAAGQAGPGPGARPRSWCCWTSRPTAWTRPVATTCSP